MSSAIQRSLLGTCPCALTHIYHTSLHILRQGKAHMRTSSATAEFHGRLLTNRDHTRHVTHPTAGKTYSLCTRAYRPVARLSRPGATNSPLDAGRRHCPDFTFFSALCYPGGSTIILTRQPPIPCDPWSSFAGNVTCPSPTERPAPERPRHEHMALAYSSFCQ